MNTLDLLERAHARLTEMRDQATPGPWILCDDDNGVETGYGGVDLTGHPLAVADNVYTQASRDLIVSLHRTIDAQLKILAGDIVIYKELVEAGQWAAAEAAIERAGDADLARAILGEPVDE